MNKIFLIVLGLLISFFLGHYISRLDIDSEIEPEKLLKTELLEVVAKDNKGIKLGVFSLSLDVKNLKTSKEFYESLGFTKMGGDIKMNYLIMKNENSIIGLFQGMFDNNIITFNPGWDSNAKNIEIFDDIREIQKHLIKVGIIEEAQISNTTTGPGSIIIYDPDSNMILLDQHR